MKTSFITCCLLCVILMGCAQADMVPCHFNKWIDTETNKVRAVAGGLISNYEDQDGTWEPININWDNLDDTLFLSVKDWLKCAARPNGKAGFIIKYKQHEITIVQHLTKLVLIDTLTMNWQPFIDIDNWTKPIVHDRDITWEFSWGEFRLRRDRGTLAHQLVFEKIILDSLSVIYNNLGIEFKDRIAIGNVFQYDIDGIADSVFMREPKFRKKRLKRLGKYILQQSPQYLHYPGSHNMVACENGCKPAVPVHLEWKIINAKIHEVEYVMLHQLDSIHQIMPDEALWHATDYRTTDDDVYDTYIDSVGKGSTFNDNYEECATFYVGENLGTVNISSIIACFDVNTTVSGYTITECSLAVYCEATSGNASDTAYRVFKGHHDCVRAGGECCDWNSPDSGITFMDFNCDDLEWGQAGCKAAGTGGDNETDGGGDDYHEDYLAVIDVSGTGWYYFDLGATIANGWRSGSMNENGVVIHSGRAAMSSGKHEFVADERTFTPNDPAPNWPYWIFWYTIPDENKGRRRRLLQMSGIDEKDRIANLLAAM